MVERFAPPQSEAAAPFWRRDARTVSTLASVIVLGVALTLEIETLEQQVLDPKYTLEVEQR